jgi:O-antigen/teichoic acid export membrane protein
MLFDFGVGASIVRYVARFEAARDRDSLNHVFSTSLCIFTIAGILSLGFAAGVAVLGMPLFSRIPPDLIQEARWLLVLLGLNLAVGLPLGVFSCLLDGLGRFPAKTIIRTTMLLVRAGLFVVVMQQGGGLIPLAIIITACGVLEYLVMGVAAWHYLPALRFSFSQVSWETFRTIRGYSVDAFLILVASRVSFQTDALVIGAFLGAEFIPFFLIANRLVEYAKDSLRVMTTVLTPAVSALEVQGDYGAIRNILLDTTRYVVWLILPIQAGLLILGKPFLALWMQDPPDFAEKSFPTLVILAIPLALTMSQSVPTRILFGTSRLRWFSRACLVEAFFNFVLSVTLVTSLGIEGVALGTALPNVVLNVGLAVYICLTLGVSVGRYLRTSFLLPLAPTGLLALFWVAAVSWLAPLDRTSLVVIGMVGLAGYGVMALVLEFGPRRVEAFLRERIGKSKQRLSKETRDFDTAATTTPELAPSSLLVDAPSETPMSR